MIPDLSLLGLIKVGWLLAVEHHDSHNRNRGLFGFEAIFVSLGSRLLLCPVRCCETQGWKFHIGVEF